MDAGEEYDLDSLVGMLDSDMDEDVEGSREKQGDVDDGDLEALANLVDFESENSPAVEIRGRQNGTKESHIESQELTNISCSELGLEMSDDECEETSKSKPAKKSKMSAFGNAFVGSKFATASQESDVDPLEAEIQKMEARMSELKNKLADKKRLSLDSNDSKRRFTKLTNVQETSKRRSRQLSVNEKANLLKSIHDKKSELHAGDTDSEDDEDKRNPFEPHLTDFGRHIKKRIAHDPSAMAPSAVPKPKELVDRLKGAGTSKAGWKDTSGSLVGLRGAAEAVSAQDKNVSVDSFSGIRIINPAVSTDVMKERMEGRKMVHMSTIPLHVRGGEIEGDWVTIGVLVSKTGQKTSQKGSQYSIWQLSDLKDCTKSVGLFLFGSSHQHLWKTSIGTVVGILNPQIMKERPGEKTSNIITLSVGNHHAIMVMGASKDLGLCKGRTKKGSQCHQYVNKNTCEFCIYHIQREYQKSSARRADIQSSFTRVDPRKRLQEKVLGKEQVFYGGQLFVGQIQGSKKVAGKPQPQASKGKDMATLSSLKLKLKAEEIKEEDRKKSFVLNHMDTKEIDAVKDMVQKNNSLGEMLLAPTPGSRNLLRHMVKEDTQKKVEAGVIKSVSAKDLLKMTHQQVQQQKKKNSFSKLSQAFSPQLGRGSEPGQEIDLDISPSRRIDPAKARALALLKNSGRLEPKKPNAVKNKIKSQDPKYLEKIKSKLQVTSEEEDNNGKRMISEGEGDSSSSKRPKLGSVNVNSEKFKAMMEQRSRHTNLIDQVENEAMDKYYMGLEKKEMLEDKMASTMEIPVTAVACVKCKYIALSASDFCKSENHHLKAIKCKKRFFECRNCKRRTTSLDKMPLKACSVCESTSWQRVAMGKPKTGPKLENEILSLRGNELKGYGGASDKVFLNVD
ncbi:minichromosome maintenance 10 homolog isoform X2 [Oratosquilla oratoria]|uniref:minichromosome maintenance 10 homolog isoform X2 n=1 Tax=Oratosquilla oratoria TaxID=337810 RepID=UPI003F7685C9